MCNAVQLKVMLKVDGHVICHTLLTLIVKACLDCVVLLWLVIGSADHMSDFQFPCSSGNSAVQLQAHSTGGQMYRRSNVW